LKSIDASGIKLASIPSDLSKLRDQSDELMCELFKVIAEFMRHLTRFEITHSVMIERNPNLLWRILKCLYLNLKCEVRLYKSLKLGITLFVVSLKNIVTLSRKDPSSPLYRSLENIFAKKLIQTLTQVYEVKYG